LDIITPILKVTAKRPQLLWIGYQLVVASSLEFEKGQFGSYYLGFYGAIVFHKLAIYYGMDIGGDLIHLKRQNETLQSNK